MFLFSARARSSQVSNHSNVGITQGRADGIRLHRCITPSPVVCSIPAAAGEKARSLRAILTVWRLEQPVLVAVQRRWAILFHWRRRVGDLLSVYWHFVAATSHCSDGSLRHTSHLTVCILLGRPLSTVAVFKPHMHFDLRTSLLLCSRMHAHSGKQLLASASI